MRPRKYSIAKLDRGRAIIPLSGILTKNESLFSMLDLGTSTRQVRIDIRLALSDEDIDQIILLIDSPGGTVDGTHALVREIREARQEKPVIAQVDGVAESAAYWIACACDRIYAGPGDMVGGVGMRMMLFDYSKAFKMDGIEAIPIDTGKFKSAGARGTEITKEHRDHFQEQINLLFQDFKLDVLRGRGARILDHMDLITEGGSFMGRDALKLGLIDGIREAQDTLAGVKSNQSAKARARWRDIDERLN